MQWDLCWEGRRGNNRWQVEYNQGPEGVTLLEYHTVISLFDLCISLHVPILYTIKSTENIPLNCLIVWLPNQHKRHGRALFVCSSCWAAGQYPNSPLIMGLSLSITVKAHATHTPWDTWPHSNSAHCTVRHICRMTGCQWRACKWLFTCSEWFNIRASDNDGLMVPFIMPAWNSLFTEIKAPLWSMQAIL